MFALSVADPGLIAIIPYGPPDYQESFLSTAGCCPQTQKSPFCPTFELPLLLKKVIQNFSEHVGLLDPAD